MPSLGELYEWLWFHTEFWLTPIDRRPYTFIIRDYIFLHPWWAGMMIVAWYVGLIILNFYSSWASWTLGVSSSFILAHIIWGSKWIEGQQEHPEYLGD